MRVATAISANSTKPRSATRLCGRCCAGRGLAELREDGRLQALQQALVHARDDQSPDWNAVGAAGRGPSRHHRPRNTHDRAPRGVPGRAPDLGRIENVIRSCGAHLLRSYRSNGFIPTYAAFNLIGDPDCGGRELLMALNGLDARGYKNSTLLFNLARVFIARSPAAGVDQPALARHRRTDVAADADPASLGLLRRLLHRSAVEFCRDRACLARSGKRLAGARSPTWSNSASSPARKRSAPRTAAPSMSSPRWRRCRIRASAASSPRSSRTSASASMCRIAIPRPVRSRPRRKPARPIRSSTSRCSIWPAGRRHHQRAAGHRAAQ